MEISTTPLRMNNSICQNTNSAIVPTHSLTHTLSLSSKESSLVPDHACFQVDAGRVREQVQQFERV